MILQKVHPKHIWQFSYLTVASKSYTDLDCLVAVTAHAHDSAAGGLLKSELIVFNAGEGEQSSGQLYAPNCKTFQLSEPFTKQESS